MRHTLAGLIQEYDMKQHTDKFHSDEYHEYRDALVRIDELLKLLKAAISDISVERMASDDTICDASWNRIASLIGCTYTKIPDSIKQAGLTVPEVVRVK